MLLSSLIVPYCRSSLLFFKKFILNYRELVVEDKNQVVQLEIDLKLPSLQIIQLGYDCIWSKS